jgi:hypothetical protein
MVDEESTDTWTSKKSKVSSPILMRMLALLTHYIFIQTGMDIRIKVHVGKERRRVKITVNIT